MTEDLETVSQEIPERDIRYRKATVFKSSDLSPNLRVILAGWLRSSAYVSYSYV